MRFGGRWVCLAFSALTPAHYSKSPLGTHVYDTDYDFTSFFFPCYALFQHCLHNDMRPPFSSFLRVHYTTSKNHKNQPKKRKKYSITHWEIPLPLTGGLCQLGSGLFLSLFSFPLRALVFADSWERGRQLGGVATYIGQDFCVYHLGETICIMAGLRPGLAPGLVS